ncbi:NAD-dependent epimerase/dehydratase family protein [Rhizobium sp. SG741]|uniref:NAD-dependent epimerase/dehydratase family protein n=1 Tax=Rhizobium sp. SG741 TaxID=2587114 RepID=UPI00064618F6|nr:NAD-dependent epimerase/dehydratase family protein [Rhizobium sp. SG741]NKJ09839.1 nucleoside-diphosphate-sugar epimerase [Rhizobium sp. SG741]
MRVLITGADGFLGSGLAWRLANTATGLSRLTLTDRQFVGKSAQIAGADLMPGDLKQPDFLDTLFEPGFDIVYHLASMPGGQAEAESERGRKINLTMPLDLAWRTAASRPGARFVFASSIAVYGDVAVEVISEATPTSPGLSYGAHKLMTEILLTDLARRGELSAISLRFPGLVARPPTESGHGSAFMSQIFHKIGAGEDFLSPVPASARCWWMSRAAAVETLLQASNLQCDAPTVLLPPALYATMAEMVQAIAAVVGRPASIQWGDDARLTRLFGAMPDIDASLARGLGIAGDADLQSLARVALSGD